MRVEKVLPLNLRRRIRKADQGSLLLLTAAESSRPRCPADALSERRPFRNHRRLFRQPSLRRAGGEGRGQFHCPDFRRNGFADERRRMSRVTPEIILESLTGLSMRSGERAGSHWRSAKEIGYAALRRANMGSADSMPSGKFPGMKSRVLSAVA
jgi:hypothetical protein